jgi:hypothetical protein
MEIYLNLLSNKTAMISRNLDHQKKTYTHALFLRVSEWLLFNANAAMFKLYHVTGIRGHIYNSIAGRISVQYTIHVNCNTTINISIVSEKCNVSNGIWS